MQVQTFSENILISIVRAQQNVQLQKHRKIACELFLPILPLLVSLALSSTKLGQLVSSVVDPDADNRMPTITIIKANIVWLYSRDNHFRSEGLNRLSYMLQKMENSPTYLPNINHMTDILQPNLCFVSPIAQNTCDEFNNIHEYDSLQSLLAMLANDGLVDRSLRHQALAQIDFMALDAKCTDAFYSNNGIRIVLSILDKALLVNSYANYANDATVVVSILRKVCMRIPQARAQLANDIHAYTLLLRALLLFQHDDGLRRNVAALLFMLAVNEFIVGGTMNGGLNLPPILKRLNVPIECEFGWKSSHRDLFACLLTTNEINETGRILYDRRGKKQSPSHNRQPAKHNERCWRYLRMAFSATWFGSLDNCNSTSNYLHGTHHRLNYKINPNALSFNEALQLQTSDMEIIEGTSPLAGIQYWMKHIQSATTSSQVADGLAAIESFSNVDAVGYRTQWNCDLFLDSIRRFCTTAPNNPSDERLFVSICRLLINLIERDAIKMLLWILGEFNRDKCLFIDLLKRSKVSVPVFTANVQLLEAVLVKTIQAPVKKHFEQLIFWGATTKDKHSTTRKSSTHHNLYEKMFDILSPLLDELILEKRFGECLQRVIPTNIVKLAVIVITFLYTFSFSVELGSVISLLRAVTSSSKIPANYYTTSFVANKLLKLIAALNSNHHVGSSFVKNSLLAIGNLMMGLDELRIDDKHLRLLIVLCGHADLEIRTFSWSILLKIASNLTQTETLLQIAMKEGLPNGLFGCSLHTLLDDEESAIVRENAGFMFATLLMQYTSCTTDDRFQRLLPKNAPSNWLELLLKHYQLFEKVTRSLKFLYVQETFGDRYAMPIVPCNLMRSYCVVLVNVLPLKVVDVNRIVSVSVEMCR